jgi:hypothetical protein
MRKFATTGMRLLGALAAAASLSFSAAAAAQNGAMWVDRYGRMTTLTMSGGETPAPAPADRTAAEMAALFQQMCVAPSADPAAAGLTALPFTTGGRSPSVFDIWHGPGVVLARSERFFITQKAQCNAVFYVNTLPERQAVHEAVSAALGAPPSNAARATKRNGQPNRSFVPEWSVGTAQVAVAHVGRSSPSLPGHRVQLSLRAR